MRQNIYYEGSYNKAASFLGSQDLKQGKFNFSILFISCPVLFSINRSRHFFIFKTPFYWLTAASWEENKIWRVKLREFLRDCNKLKWQLETTTITILRRETGNWKHGNCWGQTDTQDSLLLTYSDLSSHLELINMIII